jgi:hypothetical protein
MTVTKKTISNRFAVNNVKQVGSKQLFKAYSTHYATSVYYSYCTIIAFKYNMQWIITGEWFSSTTTRHKNDISKLENNTVVLDSKDFETMLHGCYVNKQLIN